MSTDTIPVQATGRMRGYTNEIDWVERQVQNVLLDRRPTFVVTDRKAIGTRGLSAKRPISMYEYEIRAETRENAASIVKLADFLVGLFS